MAAECWASQLLSIRRFSRLIGLGLSLTAYKVRNSCRSSLAEHDHVVGCVQDLVILDLRHLISNLIKRGV
jgi:hypothetical protein